MRRSHRSFKHARLSPRVDLGVDVYRLVATAVELGVESGWNRAHKHTDDPGADHVKAEIETAIMNNLSEVFIWPSTTGEA